MLILNIVVGIYLLDPQSGDIISMISLVGSLILNIGFLLLLLFKVLSLTYLSYLSLVEKKIMKRKMTKGIKYHYDDFSISQNERFDEQNENKNH